MLAKTVLVKDISSLSEARYCSGMLVDYISFEFNKDEASGIDIEKYKEIKNWISGIKVLASLKDGNIEEIQALLNSIEIDGFLFYENQILIAEDINTSLKAMEINEYDSNYKYNADLIIIKKYSADIKFEPEKKILLGYAFDQINEDYNDALGYAFKGSIELNPGINNYDKLMDAFEILEN